MKRVIPLLAALAVAPAALAQDTFAERVAAASTGDHRSEANIARNDYRHPVETLEFFGFEDGDTVLEIWPGGGWYTEVLAPAIRDNGTFVIANWDPEVPDQPGYRYSLPKQLAEKFANDPEVYDQVEVVYFSSPETGSLGEDNSYDTILTFRNTHGWVGGGEAQGMFDEFARVLKPGGTLGVVQHRADDGTDPAETAKNGYVSEEYVKELAASAGLEFVAVSEVNANPKDTKDHPKGVWTLPPGLALGDEDKAKYEAIGESDRMTLKFTKP
ncbi:class I SAM-dependent methyltransferase [Marinihelvus fidelis]|uniref:Class I SAM-dependent methyltransferase n=1 Tax=Marinihelvus fidelis TaxID=2613842 RepID=A0A5N0TFP5_9GAMM|nr:class I SAM-dependent methyltransferase [Marinihelvus fidelis]KAA9133318.1 class I SAM-dependent methyltransferase [Marinihelvus fidelis]